MVGGTSEVEGLVSAKALRHEGAGQLRSGESQRAWSQRLKRRGWTGSRAEQTQAEPAGSGDKKDTLPKWGHVGMKDMVIFTLGQKMGMVLANSDV